MLEEYSERIRKWLEEEGLEPTIKPDQNTKITFNVKSGQNVISIGFHKTSTDSVIIGTGIEFNEDEQKMLKFLKTKNDILLDLQKFLIQMHLEPTFKWNENKDSFEKISFQKTIYFDGLTKNKFYEILADVFQSINVVREGFLHLGRTT